MPYCNLATNGLLEMNSKMLRFTLKGMGTMRVRKSSISNTRSAKTCDRSMSAIGISWFVSFVIADWSVDQAHFAG